MVMRLSSHNYPSGRRRKKTEDDMVGRRGEGFEKKINIWRRNIQDRSERAVIVRQALTLHGL